MSTTDGTPPSCDEYEAYYTGDDCDTPFTEALANDPGWLAYRVASALFFAGLMYYIVIYQLGAAIDRHSDREVAKWRTLSPQAKKAAEGLTPFDEGEAFQAAVALLVVFGGGCRVLFYCGQLFAADVWGPASAVTDTFYTLGNTGWFSAGLLMLVPIAGLKSGSLGARSLRYLAIVYGGGSVVCLCAKLGAGPATTLFTLFNTVNMLLNIVATLLLLVSYSVYSVKFSRAASSAAHDEGITVGTKRRFASALTAVFVAALGMTMLVALTLILVATGTNTSGDPQKWLRFSWGYLLTDLTLQTANGMGVAHVASSTFIAERARFMKKQQQRSSMSSPSAVVPSNDRGDQGGAAADADNSTREDTNGSAAEHEPGPETDEAAQAALWLREVAHTANAMRTRTKSLISAVAISEAPSSSSSSSAVVNDEESLQRAAEEESEARHKWAVAAFGDNEDDRVVRERKKRNRNEPTMKFKRSTKTPSITLLQREKNPGLHNKRGLTVLSVVGTVHRATMAVATQYGISLVFALALLATFVIPATIWPFRCARVAQLSSEAWNVQTEEQQWLWAAFSATTAFIIQLWSLATLVMTYPKHAAEIKKRLLARNLALAALDPAYKIAVQAAGLWDLWWIALPLNALWLGLAVTNASNVADLIAKQRNEDGNKDMRAARERLAVCLAAPPILAALSGMCCKNFMLPAMVEASDQDRQLLMLLVPFVFTAFTCVSQALSKRLAGNHAGTSWINMGIMVCLSSTFIRFLQTAQRSLSAQLVSGIYLGLLEIGEVFVYAPKQAFTAFALTRFRERLPHDFFERPRPRRLRADLRHAESMLSQVGIWVGFGFQATIKLVHGGRYGAREVDDAGEVILETLGSAVLVTLVSALFDQLAYFCESYYCDIPVLRVWETCDWREKFLAPVAVTATLGFFFMTAGFVPPMAAMALGELPANITEELLEGEELCGL